MKIKSAFSQRLILLAAILLSAALALPSGSLAAHGGGQGPPEGKGRKPPSGGEGSGRVLSSATSGW